MMQALAMVVFPDVLRISKAPLIIYFNQTKPAYFKYIMVRTKVEMLPFPNFMYTTLMKPSSSISI